MNKDKELDESIFEQIEEALEERDGADRRKKNLGLDTDSGLDRRKSDRRKPETES